MATTTIGNELLRKPDVYLIETEVGGQALQLAGTGAAAMIGVSDKGPVGEATLATSLTQFYREFGSTLTFPLVRAARAYFNMGGHRLWVVRTAHYTDITDATSYTAAASNTTITDGGEPATDVLTVEAKTPGTWGDNLIVVIENVDTNNKTFDLVVYEGASQWYAIKERWAGVSYDETDEKFVEDVVNHPYKGSKNITVTYLAGTATAPSEGTYHLTGGDNGTTGIVDADYIGDKGAGTGMYALDNVPELLTISHPGVTSASVISSALSYILYNTNRRPPQTDFYVYDIPEGYTPQDALNFIANEITVGATGYEAVYYPMLEVEGVVEPAAPYMQGVYSHNDRIRGVWQAPAGTKFPIGWASGLAYELTEGDQELLNPYGINCIVRKPFHGIVPWGARTLHVHHKDRYIQARRLVNLIKKTLYDGSQQFLFELNAPKVWKRIEETAHGLLMTLWDMGAFGGKTPEESFFAKCDEDTNPPELVEQGVCVCKIGIVPPKPIEFLIFEVMLYPEGSLPEGIEKYLST